MKNIIIALVAWICCAQVVSAQVEKRALRKGDSVPDATFPVINYGKKTLKLSDFKDKLIVIDFWILACVPCVQSLPTIDSLQRKFKDEVLFLPVTWEPRTKVQAFFDRVNAKRKFVVPFALDSGFYKLFTEGYSWSGGLIWIKNGKIIGLTAGKEALTEHGVRQALATNSIGKRVGVGKQLSTDYLRPLLINGDRTPQKSLVHYSAFTRYLPGMVPDILPKSWDEGDSTSGVRILNCSLGFFYSFAHRFDYAWDVLYEMKNPANFASREAFPDSSILYCYELITPHCTRAEVLNLMKSDLDKVFGFRVTKELREVTCGILRVKDSLRIKTKGVGTPIGEGTNFYLTLNKQPFRSVGIGLTEYMVSANQRFVIDESGIKGNVDVSIDCDLRDPVAVQAALSKIGIQLTFEKRQKEMIIIRDPAPALN